MGVMFSQVRSEWFGNVRNDLLSGTVVALALIPEAIAFSIIAGVDPQLGLYASFCIAITIAIVGGRPGMISAATGAMALVLASLVRDYGLEYLFATTVLTGMLQIVAGVLRLGSLLRFLSRSVTIGFVNALAILIFMAQLPEFNGAGWQMYLMVAAGLAIIYLFPRISKAVPSPLVCIIVLTIVSIGLGLNLRTVGDMGILPTALPVFALPTLPITFETLAIILPYALTLTAVGLLESLMTAVIVDDMTDTPSNKNRECWGQGVANIVSGCFGGMAGCAMIGQSVINVKSGGRGRLSTFFAGGFLLFLILVLGDWVKQIPMAALVAVMIMVSVGTFNWGSITKLRTTPVTSSLVTFVTVTVVLFTHDLAQGVLVGVLMSAIFFVHKVSRLLKVESTREEGSNQRIYTVIGQVFFASTTAFGAAFNYKEDLEQVTIDLTHAHFWDISAVGALDTVVLKFRREGKNVSIIGLNEASATIIDRLAIYDKSEALSLKQGEH
jgi:SulP family sulfate permease